MQQQSSQPVIRSKLEERRSMLIQQLKKEARERERERASSSVLMQRRERKRKRGESEDSR